MISKTNRNKGNRAQIDYRALDKLDNENVIKIRRCLKDSEKTTRQILLMTNLTMSQFKSAILLMSHQDLYENEKTNKYGIVEYYDNY